MAPSEREKERQNVGSISESHGLNQGRFKMWLKRLMGRRDGEENQDVIVACVTSPHRNKADNNQNVTMSFRRSLHRDT